MAPEESDIIILVIIIINDRFTCTAYRFLSCAISPSLPLEHSHVLGLATILDPFEVCLGD